MDKKPRPRVADLPGIIENAHDRPVNCCVHVVQIIHENLRAFAAGFKRDAFEV